MSFIRGVFCFALLMLLTGIVGSRYIMSYLFGSQPGSSFGSVAMAVQTATPHRASPTNTPTSTSTPTPTATRLPIPRRTATPHPRATPTTAPVRPKAVVRRHVMHRVRHKVRRHPRPTPVPSPTTGVVTLIRYWVGSPAAAPGQTISIGYVIDNGTGQPARIELGASIKSDRVLSWLTGQINDPSHDIVAVVPPGVSTQLRYFTLPRSLRPGSYDVAWGLRDPLNGQREALVAAPAALRVVR